MQLWIFSLFYSNWDIYDGRLNLDLITAVSEMLVDCTEHDPDLSHKPITDDEHP